MPLLRINKQQVSAKGIIFDKDGTLNDSLAMMPRLVALRAKAICRREKRAAGLAERLVRAMGAEGTRIIRRSPITIGSRLQTATAAATVLFMELGLPWDLALELVFKAFEDADREMPRREKVIPFPGVKELIWELRAAGLRLAIATNDRQAGTENFLEFAGLQGCFDALVCVEDVLQPKPYPDLVLLAARRMSLSPAECVVVGDSTWDMEMGRRAGVKFTVGVLSGSAAREDLEHLADEIIGVVTDIIIDES